ncbi:MAG: GNAT family N-acetyltransferase [Bacteroidia bacterium]|nr:GNAT family N-acetyltransferase [Bacteroidia bacterium]
MLSFQKLEDNRVQLSLIEMKDVGKLLSIAKEPGLIQYSPGEIHTEDALNNYIGMALEDYHNGSAIPLIIYDKKVERYAGSTRFGKIDHFNKVLHIGWTWIGKDFQGSGLNNHMKYLMLEYAFETLGFFKVEFRIDERNTRSRHAVEKIGATLEGILRKDTILSDGFRRNTCCYGILIEEWPDIKADLISILSK